MKRNNKEYGICWLDSYGIPHETSVKAASEEEAEKKFREIDNICYTSKIIWIATEEG